jgi:MFS family permease
VTLPSARRNARHVTRISLPLVGAFAIGAIAYGGMYTFPALSVAFGSEFGISRALAVTPWTMYLVVTAVASPLLGRAYDEFADRDLLTAAMVLVAGGWLAVYLAPDISIIILAFAALHAPGLQLAFIGTSTAIARRYAGMSGLALGITYAGPGLGVAVAMPVAAGLIQTSGWRAAALVFLAASLVGVAFVWLMTSGPAIVVPAHPRPAKPRTLPAIDATEGGVAVHEAAGAPTDRVHEEPRHGARRVMRTRRFWLLFTGAVTIGMIDEGVLQAFVPNAVRAGIGADVAALALGVQSLTYVFGQVIGGWASDHLGRRAIGITAGILAFGGVVLAIGGAGAGFGFAFAGIALHGVATGAIIAVRSAAFHDVFGGAGFGTVFGILAVAYPVGGTVAVYAGAILSDRLGTYLPIVPVLGVAAATWCVALWAAGPFRHGAQRRSGS